MERVRLHKVGHPTWEQGMQHGVGRIKQKVLAPGRFEKPQAMALGSKFDQRVDRPGVSISK
ncbi:unnamed protein product [Ixodes persulcatus]